MSSPITSLIISVYKDNTALELILSALFKQSVTNFEIIISEDGCCETIQETAKKWCEKHSHIHHLSQEDTGFRKNRALNRAITYAKSNHLIFIDGDCIPHPFFIQAHQKYMSPGYASAGRRAELGPKISSELRTGKLSLDRLFNSIFYILMLPRLLTDNINHAGQGIPLKTLQKFANNRHIRILGCNFSCHRQDLYKINGFNEEFISAGWGEDSDIEWRLRHINVNIKNVKFSAIQYHLHHERWYQLEEDNRSIFETSKRKKKYYCENGLQQHITNNKI